MDRADIIEIAEGLKLLEEGITKIQNVMRNKKIKSIREMAEELLPVLGEDDSLKASIFKNLE